MKADVLLDSNYSEDLSDGPHYDAVKVINPFRDLD